MAALLEVSKRGGVVVLAPRGSVNTESAPKLEQALLAQLTAGEKLLVVDFSGVDYISSAGLRVLLMTAKRLKVKGGSIALCSMSSTVAKVFALCGFERDFTILENRDKAVARLGQAAPSAVASPAAPAPPAPPAADRPVAATAAPAAPGTKAAPSAPKAPSPRQAPPPPAQAAPPPPSPAPSSAAAVVTAAVRVLSTGLPPTAARRSGSGPAPDVLARVLRALGATAQNGR